MEYVPGKTPVSLLQEICTRRNITPKYELLQVEGAVHEPTFQYRLSLEYNGTEYEQTGSGRSKKEAKHNTALAMLVSMGLLPSDTAIEKNECLPPPENEDIRSGLDGDLGGNPVGLLQELCMKLKHPPPTYEVHSEEGLPHERIFAMACRVGEHFVEIGRGKSKKLAKRQAAALMAERLRNIPSDSANVFDFDEDDDKICERIVSLREKKTSSLHDGTLLGKCQAVARYKFSDKEISEIQDPIKFLSSIEDICFKALHIDLDEVSSVDTFQCFFQITSDPPVVAIGEGVTRECAKRNAALDAIEMFIQLRNSAIPSSNSS